jgi:hypothetical protein
MKYSAAGQQGKANALSCFHGMSTFQFVCDGEIESRTLLTTQIQAFTSMVFMLHNILRCLYLAL